WQSPGRGCPDQRENFSSDQRWINLSGIALKRKLNVNRRTGVLVIFNFRFSQRGLIVDAPVDRTRTFVNEAALDKVREQSRRLGFVVIGHGDVGIVPLAQDADPFKIARLSL